MRSFFLLLLAGCTGSDVTKEDLGRELFFDADLSSPVGLACAGCHAPEAGWADPRGTATSEGAVGLFGPRNAPSVAYATFSPERSFDPSLGDDGAWVGGQFWDGRAGTLAEQAAGPFLAHVEMDEPSKDALVAAVEDSDYARDFKAVYGRDVFKDVDSAFDDVTDAIQAFESSDEVNPFSSKYDAVLAGSATLTEAEARGLQVAQDNRCLICHSDQASPPVFTDHRYVNIGVPANPDNRWYDMPPDVNPDGDDYVDLGLGAILDDATRNGFMKIPTLRNVELTAPYMHNGAFDTLDEVVLFYSTRDTNTDFQPAEVPDTQTDFIGNFQLSEQERSDLVAFLLTLTDGWAGE